MKLLHQTGHIFNNNDCFSLSISDSICFCSINFKSIKISPRVERQETLE